MLSVEELAVALAAIHKYLKEKEKPIEIKEVPRYWKLSARMMP